MYRCILVPLDRSGCSERLLRRVQLLVRNRGSIVHVLIVHPPTHRPERLPCLLEPQRRPRPCVYEVLTRLHAEGATVRAEIRCGDPVESILAAAQEVGADLIAMTVPWHGEAGPWPAANIPAQIIKKAALPVLVERSHDLSRSPNVKHICCQKGEAHDVW
jgi:nucleotide-binding universal stress UspA family protein